MAKEYYFISDLHIGGDAELDICDFEGELIAFLKDFKDKDKDTELIIVGDTFGLWELTEIDGAEKVQWIISTHRKLFEQFKKTGKHIRITIIPGNHDHELACYEGFLPLLAEYNIILEPCEYITRDIGNKKIWIEHGNQRDEFNRITDFGNPHATPLGYFSTRQLISVAGKQHHFGRQKWLRDIESVQPNEDVPGWFMSNYFYREMSPLLRYTLLPFLLLFSFTVIALGGLILEWTGLLPTAIFRHLFKQDLGVFGNLLAIISTANAVFVVVFLLVSVPLWFIMRDISQTLERYGVNTREKLTIQKHIAYENAAREVFARHDDVAVFIFGHTHRAFLEHMGNRVLINTGTWLKTLKRIKARFRLLPYVYFPTYSLNYFRISAEGGRIVIDYRRIPKKADPKLTLVQHIALIGRSRLEDIDIPEQTVLDFSE